MIESGRSSGLKGKTPEATVVAAMLAVGSKPGGSFKRVEKATYTLADDLAEFRNAPVNALGYLRVMFAVDDLDDTLARLREHGAQLVDEVVQYEDVYRLCYVRGPEGILIGLAERIG